METSELERLKEEFLKTNQIKVYGKKKQKEFKTSNILTVYNYGNTEYVL